MREVRRSALVPYRAVQMYTLVNNVSGYPEFLPWCRSAEVHSESDEHMEASLEMVKGRMTGRFRTHNTLVSGRSIEIGLVNGPFRSLEGLWTFDALSDTGSQVKLDMRFEFESPIMGLLFSRTFEEIAEGLVDAFAARARHIYGRQ